LTTNAATLPFRTSTPFRMLLSTPVGRRSSGRTGLVKISPSSNQRALYTETTLAVMRAQCTCTVHGKVNFMSRVDDAARVGAAFGQLLLRSNRAHLYETLTGSQDGVDETTYPVLSGLARLGTATATELADQIGLDRTVTTRHATRLERAGLLLRRPHPADARATVLQLTDRGRGSIEQMREQLNKMIAQAMTSWNAEQTRTFADMFDQLVQTLAVGPPTTTSWNTRDLD
jgi:DNA-binding MarR family transcriptional regulator